MRKLLITGFEPFGGEVTNPSWDAVEQLPSAVGEYILTKMQIPVVFGEAARTVLDEAERLRPDVIIAVGQAGGRDAVTPELVAINLRYAAIPDNKGNLPKDERITEGGAPAYFTTLPVRKMAEAISGSGIPSQVSYSAGAYVCNDLLYSLSERYADSETRVGFIHVPYSKEQGKEPSMDIEDIVRALVLAIESLD